MKLRGFEVAKGWENKDIHIPIRKTANSAGYDVEAAEDVVIHPFKLGDKPTLIPTGLKAYCQSDEWFMLANRSSNPIKRGLVMANSIGVIDSDYYGNPDNDGHFMFAYYNFFNEELRRIGKDRCRTRSMHEATSNRSLYSSMTKQGT